jgi:elongation factor P
MLAAKQIRNGAIIEVNGAPHVVENVVKTTPSARGASTLYKIRARHMLNRSKTDLSCRGDESFPEPDVRTRETQYLYRDASGFVFLDLESYEQVTLPPDVLGDDAGYLVEDMEGIHILMLEGRAVGARLPDVVEQELVECDPAVKGASATARTKPATTRTGLVVQVPEYMERGEVVRVDTRSGKFLGRAT